MSACPYANALGEPGKGFHAWRIGGFAAGDILGTILLALATAYYFNISVVKSLIGWFVAAEVAHWIFGVPTAFLVWLGVAGWPTFCGATQ